MTRALLEHTGIELAELEIGDAISTRVEFVLWSQSADHSDGGLERCTMTLFDVVLSAAEQHSLKLGNGWHWLNEFEFNRLKKKHPVAKISPALRLLLAEI